MGRTGPAFTRPTARRFAVLLVAAILTSGRRTADNLATLGRLAPGHRSDYQRVFCRAPWSGLQLGCAPAGFILGRLAPEGTVVLVGDDTLDGHPGREVYGKARHRDPVRSSHAYTAWRWGHRWVVLAVLVRLPFAGPADRGRRHRLRAELADGAPGSQHIRGAEAEHVLVGGPDQRGRTGSGALR